MTNGTAPTVALALHILIASPTAIMVQPPYEDVFPVGNQVVLEFASHIFQLLVNHQITQYK